MKNYDSRHSVFVAREFDNDSDMLDRPALFKKEIFGYVANLAEDCHRARRNKRFITGNIFYTKWNIGRLKRTRSAISANAHRHKP